MNTISKIGNKIAQFGEALDSIKEIQPAMPVNNFNDCKSEVVEQYVPAARQAVKFSIADETERSRAVDDFEYSSSITNGKDHIPSIAAVELKKAAITINEVYKSELAEEEKIKFFATSNTVIDQAVYSDLVSKVTDITLKYAREIFSTINLSFVGMAKDNYSQSEEAAKVINSFMAIIVPIADTISRNDEIFAKCSIATNMMNIWEKLYVHYSAYISTCIMASYDFEKNDDPKKKNKDTDYERFIEESVSITMNDVGIILEHMAVELNDLLQGYELMAKCADTLVCNIC